MLPGFLYAATETGCIAHRFLFLVFSNAAVPLLQSKDTERLRGGGKREREWGEEEARTDGGREEGD